MESQAKLRKQLLKEIYWRSAGDPDREINCATLAKELDISTDAAIVIVRQLEEIECVKFKTKSLDANRANWLFVLTMQGIQEAEKLERGMVKQFYDDHFALASAIWTIAVVLISVLANQVAAVIFNTGKNHIVVNMPEQKINVPEQKPPIVTIMAPEQKQPIVNVTVPEQKPPIVNVIVPEQKKPAQ